MSRRSASVWDTGTTRQGRNCEIFNRHTVLGRLASVWDTGTARQGRHCEIFNRQSVLGRLASVSGREDSMRYEL